MMKGIVTLSLLLTHYFVFGQHAKPYSRLLLEKAIMSEDFKNHFRICKSVQDTLVISDTAGYFAIGSLPDVCNRKMRLSNTWPSRILDVNHYSSKASTNDIVLLVATNKKKVWRLIFWYPINNTSVNVELVKSKNEVVIKETHTGVF